MPARTAGVSRCLGSHSSPNQTSSASSSKRAIPGSGSSACTRTGAHSTYRLASADWLVSEVGRGNEGRGRDLQQALAALSAGVSPPDWWDAVAEALDGDSGPGR